MSSDQFDLKKARECLEDRDAMRSTGIGSTAMYQEMAIRLTTHLLGALREIGKQSTFGKFDLHRELSTMVAKPLAMALRDIERHRDLTDNQADTRQVTYGTREPINPDFGEGRWQDALRRMRGRIAGETPLDLVDSNMSGDKHTHCSWGMCSRDPEQWPDPDDHTWPESFTREGRVAPRHQRETQFCPMDRKDTKQTETLGPGGCFYRCRMFTPNGEPRPDRKIALQLYDEVIAARESTNGFLTFEDDHEPWRSKR